MKSYEHGTRRLLLVLLILILATIFISIRFKPNAKQSSNSSLGSHSTIKPVISLKNKYFSVDNGALTEIESGKFVTLAELNVQRQNISRQSVSPLFNISTKDLILFATNNKTKQEIEIDYKLKKSDVVEEGLNSVVYSLNGKEAIINLIAYDKTSPISEFDGSYERFSINSYRYSYESNTFATTDIPDIAYKITGEDRNLLGFGLEHNAWDSEKNILYSSLARFGEGGDGALVAYYVLDTAKQTVVASLKPESEKSIEIPRLYAQQGKLVTIKAEDDRKKFSLNIYDMNKPDKPEKSVALPSPSEPADYHFAGVTSDGSEVILRLENSYPYVHKAYKISLSSGSATELYSDDTVLRDDAYTMPTSDLEITPDDKGIVYVDYTNLHQQPAGPSRLEMKVEDNRYDLIFIDFATKKRQVIYDGRELYILAGFTE